MLKKVCKMLMLKLKHLLSLKIKVEIMVKNEEVYYEVKYGGLYGL